MEYKIKRSLTGAQSIHLTCPKCHEAVIFDLEDAGSVLPCPACAAGIRVPGEAEKQAEALRKQTKEAEDRRRIEASRAAAEAQQAADAKRHADAAAAAKRANEQRLAAARWRCRTLTVWAWGSAVLAAVCLVGAVLMDVSANTTELRSVVSFDLLSVRLCLVIVGSTSLLGCVVAASASVIIHRLGQYAQHLEGRFASHTTPVQAHGEE